MQTADYLRILKDEIHSAVFATIDKNGLPDGKHSLDKKAVSVRGKIRNIGNEKLEEVFAKNPYMNEIYPSVESRSVSEVFQMYEGQREKCQSIRRIVCIVADVMKSARRKQF